MLRHIAHPSSLQCLLIILRMSPQPINRLCQSATPYERPVHRLTQLLQSLYRPARVYRSEFMLKIVKIRHRSIRTRYGLPVSVPPIAVLTQLEPVVRHTPHSLSASLYRHGECLFSPRSPYHTPVKLRPQHRCRCQSDTFPQPRPVPLHRWQIRHLRQPVVD